MQNIHKKINVLIMRFYFIEQNIKYFSEILFTRYVWKWNIQYLFNKMFNICSMKYLIIVQWNIQYLFNILYLFNKIFNVCSIKYFIFVQWNISGKL